MEPSRAGSSESSGTSKLQVLNLAKHYERVRAVDGVSLAVQEGEFLTLLGQSGSGKTTLLMMVAGLTAPSSGEVWIDGELATYKPSYRRDIGMVFQNYALFPHMTVAENIAFPLRMRRLNKSEIERKVSDALRLVKLPDVGDRYPAQLSGGQQQRIALARGTVYNPSILLMDEPLGALDKKLRDELQLEIKHFQQDLGITVVYVTHDQDEALTMSDRICLMHDGRVEQLGAPDDLYHRPVSRRVANFIGQSNLLRGELVLQGGQATVEMANGDVVRAKDPANLTEGQSVLAMVRPEVISFCGDSDSSTANVLRGRVTESVFMGNITKYWISMGNGDAIMMTELTNNRADRAQTGSDVCLSWSPEATVLLPDSGNDI